jgi:uncharacterized protein
MELIGYCAAILIGLVLGMLGSGGSILSIPILVYLFKMDIVIASAYSLFIVGVTSLVGAIPKYKEQLVNLRTGFFFSIPSIISIFSTRKWVVPAIPDIIFQTESFVITKRILLLGLFAVLMILASISMIRGRQRESNEDHHTRVFLVMVEGILIGLLSGLVGAGGGFLIIPALVLLTGLPFKTAVGTSLLIIAINSLTGFMADALTYSMNWSFLLAITSLAILGILLGNLLSRKVSQNKLRVAFGYFVFLTGCWILTRELFF